MFIELFECLSHNSLLYSLDSLGLCYCWLPSRSYETLSFPCIIIDAIIYIFFQIKHTFTSCSVAVVCAYASDNKLRRPTEREKKTSPLFLADAVDAREEEKSSCSFCCSVAVTRQLLRLCYKRQTAKIRQHIFVSRGASDVTQQWK